MFDENGMTDFSDTLQRYETIYSSLTDAAQERASDHLVDVTARTGYALLQASPKTPHEMAAEYYTFDWEYAQTPEVPVCFITAYCTLD